MLPRKYKIGSRNLIEKILKRGRQFRTRFFFYRYAPNRNPVHRFSLVLPKNMTRSAVMRNGARRRIYEAIRRNFPLRQGSCYDVVVLPTRKTLHLNYADIEKDLKLALDRL